MIVNSVLLNSSKTHISFKQHKSNTVDESISDKDSTQKFKSIYKKAGFLAATAIVGFGIYKLYKGGSVNSSSDVTLDYITNLASDMSNALGKKISLENLSSIMTKDELVAVLPKLNKENYFAYKQDILPDGHSIKVFEKSNLENGVFKIDLHSHTNYSDGQANVEELLNNVVEYANKLQAKHNEKFIFSITDHDGLGGVKEALKLIADNPEKYKNIKFVPGIELTYAHIGKNNRIVVSEILAHGINPYSPELNAFVDKITSGRKNLFNTVINELNNANLGVKFDINEMDGDFFAIKNNHDWFKYNLHWKLYNYVQIKQRLSKLAKKWGKNPEQEYKIIMPDWHIWANLKNPNSFEEFLKSRNVDLTDTVKIDKNIDKICYEFFPKIENGQIIASSERTFDDIIKIFKDDKNVVLSFAHPAFTAQNLDNPKAFFKDLIDNSSGLLIGTERHHMSYFLPIKKGSITQESVDNTNKLLDEFNLLNVGGHDNHSATLLN